MTIEEKRRRRDELWTEIERLKSEQERIGALIEAAAGVYYPLYVECADHDKREQLRAEIKAEMEKQ